MESSSRYLCGLAILSVFLALSLGAAVSVGTDIIKIISVNYLDPDQWVEIANYGTGSMNLTGWTLINMENQTFSIPAGFTLKAGSLVRVHAGKGNNTSSDLYNSALAWKKTGDTATLVDETGTIISEYKYPIKVSASGNMANIKPIFLPNMLSIGASQSVQEIQSDYNAQRSSLNSNIPVNLTGCPFICHGGPLNWAWTTGQ
jgi:Lamin Tail Domain